jgi:hypothetical protein
MTYAWTQDLPISREMYDRIRTKLDAKELKGLEAHLAVEIPGGGIRYIDVWESKDHYERAMDDVIHPVVFSVFQEMGFTPMAEPPRTDLTVIDFRTSRG